MNAMLTKIKTAVILAGGVGTRMGDCGDENSQKAVPKPMLDIAGKPLLHWTIEKWLARHDIRHIVIGVAYRKEFIIDYFSQNALGTKIDFSEHSIEGETGEGFRKAIARCVDDDIFLAMNGDELTNLNIYELVDFHMRKKGIATVVAAPLEVPYGVLEIDGNCNITGFLEKPVRHDILISAGVYIFNHEILDYLPLKGRIEDITFKDLAKKGLLAAYTLPSDKKWFTVNNPKQLAIAEREIHNLWG